MSTPRSFRLAFTVVAAATLLGTLVSPAVAAPAKWATPYPGGHLVANAASPDGSTVFATGWIGAYDARTFLTIAYDAGTGERLWAKTYGGGQQDQGASLAVSPDGVHRLRRRHPHHRRGDPRPRLGDDRLRHRERRIRWSGRTTPRRSTSRTTGRPPSRRVPTDNSST